MFQICHRRQYSKPLPWATTPLCFSYLVAMKQIFAETLNDRIRLDGPCCITQPPMVMRKCAFLSLFQLINRLEIARETVGRQFSACVVGGTRRHHAAAPCSRGQLSRLAAVSFTRLVLLLSSLSLSHDPVAASFCLRARQPTCGTTGAVLRCSVQQPLATQSPSAR